MGVDNTIKTHMRVKLIYNSKAGNSKNSSELLMDVLKEMQKCDITPEPYLIEPECNLSQVVQDAVQRGIQLIVVCGGDGTVSSVARAMIGTNAAMGIIPLGTRNNVALSLGIPSDIEKAVAILRTGRRLKMDLGISICNHVKTPFIEHCSVGLLSELFEAGDEIQHGKLTRIGDFMGTLFATQPSEIRLVLEDNHEIILSGHVAIISNTPYIISNNKVSALDSYHDGMLDVILFTDTSKLNLLGHVLSEACVSELNDPGILLYKVRKISIDTHPPMSIMADSVAIGEGSVQIEVKEHAITVMVEASENDIASGEAIE